MLKFCVHVGTGVLAVVGGFAVLDAHSQTPAQAVSAMAANEVAARNQDNLYSYVAEEISARTGGHRWTEKVIETSDGPLHRLLAVDGKPLTPGEAKAEGDRISAIVRNPDDFRRTSNLHKDDEVRAQQLLQLLPRAFTITPAGEADGCAVFSFRANPAFQPSSYEERVAVAMVGTVSLKQPVDRLCSLQAKIAQPVEFGFGFLGRIEEGGRFSLERRPVDPIHWKSEYISVHIQGRILLLKSLTREQEVRRTNVHIVPSNISLEQAALMTAQ